MRPPPGSILHGRQQIVLIYRHGIQDLRPRSSLGGHPVGLPMDPVGAGTEPTLAVQGPEDHGVLRMRPGGRATSPGASTVRASSWPFLPLVGSSQAVDWASRGLRSLPRSLNFTTGSWHNLAHGYKLAHTEIQVPEEQCRPGRAGGCPAPPAMSVEVGASVSPTW